MFLDSAPNEGTNDSIVIFENGANRRTTHSVYSYVDDDKGNIYKHVNVHMETIIPLATQRER